MGDHKEFLKRITKTLYYGQLPSVPCLSLPVTEISCALWSAAQRGRSLRRLHADAAARLAHAAHVSPCALVLAVLYLERLQRRAPAYLTATAPDHLFLVSLMVGNKFLQDDGEDDEMMCSDWAASGGIDLKDLKKLEVEFLNAIEWDVYVSSEEFSRRLAWLERAVALRQAAARGWFTYSDLLAARPALLAGAVTALAALAAVAALAGLTAAHSTPAPPRPAARPAPAPAAPAPSPDSHTLALDPARLAPLSNATLDSWPERPACCTTWSRTQSVWPAAAPAPAPPAPWWQVPAALGSLGWLQLARPLQRWLRAEPEPCCGPGAAVDKLRVFLAAVSDR